MGRPKGSGIRPDVKRARTNLAILLRECIHEEIIRDWFLMILSGKNPVIVEDLRCTEQGCLRVVEDPNNRIAPSPERRDQAMRSMLDRRDGLPPMKMQLDADIRAMQHQTVITAPQLATLTPKALGSVVAALRLAMAPQRALSDSASTPKSDRARDGSIDSTATEMRTSDEASS